jgi:hypothetical protein
MIYKDKQPAQATTASQKNNKTIASSAFSDQRSSTSAQLKQQQMMHAAHSPNVIQQMTAGEEPIQGEFENEAPTQLQEAPAAQPNNTGLPDNLKSGIENLSGYSMDDVKVHFNSDKPAQLNAHAYAQGTDIHVAPGQEQHLPHEAWHVVQQKQGRVQPTMQMKAGVPVNDDAGLENEADVMGAKAFSRSDIKSTVSQCKIIATNIVNNCVQASSVKTVTANYTYDSGTQTETVGRSMEATLDPGTPINGSAPGDGEQTGLMGYLKDTKNFKSMKRGHLMNGQLGGPGIAANMFPITSKANTYHQLHVENYIKKAIANDVGVFYKVDVNSNYDADSSDSAAAEFICKSWVVDSKGVMDLTQPEPFTEMSIISKPAAGSSGDGEAAAVTVNDRMRFLTKDLPDGWGEKKKGLKEWDDNLPGHFSTKKGNF